LQLTDQQKKHLRGLGHGLKPVVMVGDSGLSEAVLKEVEQALAHHELIKVRVRLGDRKHRDAAIARLCDETRSHLVVRIGHVALLFRRNAEKPRIQLT